MGVSCIVEFSESFFDVYVFVVDICLKYCRPNRYFHSPAPYESVIKLYAAVNELFAAASENFFLRRRID